ncbi:uncharacterized protein LOC128549357 [Mercenaria mercenaria]|uniref:uncharacterized protein LOC128549357 n=1 Tax=Mercenaria mercenaria TaxID=6596 RepID=UPI00234F9EF7|nr:uncharacterized protein LOC128549357 [Mercenaria mercenaria]
MLQYQISKQQKMLSKMKSLVSSEREQLGQLKSTKGHFSVRNVTKRDALAAKNRKLLREAQATIAKQKKLIEDIEARNLKLSQEDERLKHELLNSCCNESNSYEQSDTHSFEHQMKKKMLENEMYVENLLTENESLRKKVSRQLSDKNNAKRSVRYFKKNVNTLRSEIKTRNQIKTLTQTVAEKQKEIDQLQIENEFLKDDKKQKYETKNSDGSFNDSIRLCVIELAGLEVAVEKVSQVIQVISRHMFSREISKADLPTSSTVQTIVDEGHFLAKTYISTVIDAAESFGLNRDGTSRKKQKIVDTSVTLDTGDVMSLGFTRVAHESAKTINSVTKNSIDELAKLNSTFCSDKNDTANTNEEYIRNTLHKLAFSMSDRASNEKLADKLLDEWRDEVLETCENKDKTTVKHFHCMAHVLLGFHKYACTDVKSVETSLAKESGPLGRDSLPAFKYWRSSGTVVERVVRTTAETFGPAGDHLGLKDRWDADCSQKGVKSVLGNYRDNRFNGIFQTSAEVLVHADQMLDVLSTVKNPNRKLQAVKADLQCEKVRTLLQCFGLFYVKLTGPYWNLVTSGAVPYLLLYSHIQAIAAYLKSCSEDPATLLNPEGHWEANDAHGIADIPYKQRFIETVFEVNDQTKELLYQMIKTVSTAMLKCIEKQLIDFLPGGQFSEKPCQEDLRRTSYAHSTNLGCEHHFGDLDSSQKRRPNASMHHHSTVQLLKRNRKPMIGWLAEMSESERQVVLKKARQGGRNLRKIHMQAEKEVIDEISNDMINEKNKKTSKKRKRNVETECEQNFVDDADEITKDLLPIHEPYNENEYVIVAYQDQWYPGCVQKLAEQQIVVNFMCPTRKAGHFIWPARKDVQTVCNEFVIKRNFVPGKSELWAPVENC